ncbi:hypothetical protein D6851_10520 [Altericroceibacterium spongiae]|uniref:DUF3617 family protein n=2 Tax=Altericroceibacterium spongiae TaxID=2320269 RepID=A0A420EJB1_9SPHN|nr:hypothetical protein D6851_10520 [Altericroceibacterium spongiae]
MRMVKAQPGRWLAIAAVLGVAAPALAQGSGSLAMLDGLDQGLWELRMRGAEKRERICMHDGRQFIQIEHRQPGCDRFVVKDTPKEVIVQYTCHGNGYGRTSIRKESSELAQLKTQGISNGRPFSIDAELRRVGSC